MRLVLIDRPPRGRTQIGETKVRLTVESALPEANPSKVGARQLRFCEIRALHPRPGEVGARQFGVPKVGALKVGALKIRTSQIR